MVNGRIGDGVAVLVAPFIVFGTLAFATIAPAVAQLDQARSTELQNAQEGAQVQQQIDQVADDTDKIVGEYKVTIDQLENLKKYNAQLRELIKAQEEEKVSLRRQIDRISGVERDIVPLMNDMLGALKEFVAYDIPFLARERSKRVAELSTLMASADTTNSEKYRRLLEAYQIENDYGRTIEAYNGKLSEDDEAQEVTFLKIGRVAFVYQTLDGSTSFIWNPSKEGDDKWERLSGSYDTPISIAIRMAREQIPPDLIKIPVFGPQEAS